MYTKMSLMWMNRAINRHLKIKIVHELDTRLNIITNTYNKSISKEQATPNKPTIMNDIPLNIAYVNIWMRNEQPYVKVKRLMMSIKTLIK